jgi:hypothetical protein
MLIGREGATDVLSGLHEPVSSRGSVGDGLLSGEGLGRNDEEGRLRVASLELLSEMGTVDVGDEVHLEVPLGVVLEGLGDHDGSEVGSSDTDVDDVGDGLAGVALPLTRADRVGEGLDVGEDVKDLVRSGLVDLPVGEVSEGDVKDGSVLGGVDVLAGVHVIPGLLDL